MDVFVFHTLWEGPHRIGINMAKSRVCKCNSRNNKAGYAEKPSGGNLLWNRRNGIDIMNKYVKVSDIYINGGLSNSVPFNDIQTNVYIWRSSAEESRYHSQRALWYSHSNGNFENVKAFECISRQDEVKIIFQMIKRFWNTKIQSRWTVFIREWGEAKDGRFEFHI